ncbi:unnamed protein product [Vitrella brassicaformis CCMP3155]|uniref:Uncharacterized protein n=1 Tax=Vitrella brassicaformis (strain CCMP3155) TaxID=1169540 RepID=A0A0G4EUB7_VITBC|nr:unnamed protein product [Vitrella brassicaformis CCMP3155]|mmetsp:Transcript_12188/g.35272  ORF Transcript_12188/g.35272 Transcript_12188/m.35272 type:complete len:687 (-) Transcript_12188:281-2341(-)|eukprot:CEM02017.1 unnamed protein product [Vitrella brassicaformis CCMP3155]
MSKVGNLEDSAISLWKVKEAARAQLLDLLDEYPGRKVLVLDSTLAGPLGLVVEVSDLRDHGVTSWFELGAYEITTDVEQVIFLVRPTVELIPLIAMQIQASERRGVEKTYAVVFVPRRTEFCVQALKQQNVYADVQLRSYPLLLMPLDSDVLSLEHRHAFTDFHLHGDPSTLYDAALSIWQLQQHCGGAIPNIRAIGSAAKYVTELLLRFRREEMATTDTHSTAITSAGAGGDSFSSSSLPAVPPVKYILGEASAADAAAGVASGKKDGEGSKGVCEIDYLVLIDRRVDLITPLCSQFTYEGLLDAVFNIHHTHIEVGPPILTPPQGTTNRKTKVPLTSSDPLFAEIRDLHIGVLGPLLHAKANQIQQTYREKDNLKNISEINEFMKKFKGVQAQHSSLATHVNLASHISNITKEEDYHKRLQLEDEITRSGASSEVLNALEDYTDKNLPIQELYRLLCLTSVVNNGIRSKHLDALKRGIIQSYGYVELGALLNLDAVGLLRSYQGRSTWEQIKKSFHLIVEEDEAQLDISYVCSGYAPLSVRLVQKLHSHPKGWRSCQEGLNLLWGPALEVRQQPSTQPGSPPTTVALPDYGTSLHSSDRNKDREKDKRPTVVVVFFLGGCTYSEVAALRKLSQLEGGARRYVIATTEMLSSSRLFSSLQNLLGKDIHPPSSSTATERETEGGAR